MNKFKEQLITMLIEHSRIIYSVISEMGVYYSNWAENGQEEAENLEKKQNKIQLLEEDGDSIKIRLIKEFSEAGAQGLGGYVELLLKMDNLVNSAIEFVEAISHISAKINEEIKSRYHKLINTIIEMADVLKATIKSLRDKPEIVFKNTTKIHEMENNIDKIFREFMNYIYDDKALDIRLLLRIRDSIIILEELADRMHDIADLIRVLVYQ
ncbi:MAG: DUF47 family protein [Candidatus Lokiarchaeota archaeon]|nr:DUF47 family protein [Candidatus Lokiarchaeota archaeon]